MDDTTIWPTMLALVDCLTQEFAADVYPPTPGFIGVLPGSVAIADFVGSKCDGMAWVRLSTAVPSVAFPSQSFEVANGHAPFAYTLEVGVYRCAPMPKTSAQRITLPTAAEEHAATRLQLADLRVMRRAIRCCLRDAQIEHLLGSYTPVGPQGDVLGGTFNLSVSEPF